MGRTVSGTKWAWPTYSCCIQCILLVTALTSSLSWSVNTMETVGTIVVSLTGHHLNVSVSARQKKSIDPCRIHTRSRKEFMFSSFYAWLRGLFWCAWNQAHLCILVQGFVDLPLFLQSLYVISSQSCSSMAFGAPVVFNYTIFVYSNKLYARLVFWDVSNVCADICVSSVLLPLWTEKPALSVAVDESSLNSREEKRQHCSDMLRHKPHISWPSSLNQNTLLHQV